MVFNSPKDILAAENIVPSKSMGQNFLCDTNVVSKIVRLARVGTDTNVIEIGPGLGTLTRELANHAKKVVAIEKDKRLYSYLKSAGLGPTVMLFCGDAVDMDIGMLLDSRSESDSNFGSNDNASSGNKGNWTLVANLPYNVATPLVFKVLEEIHDIDKLIVMVQSEVVDRFLASPSTKTYGAVTVKLSYLADMKRLMQVPPQLFYPAPKVMSSVVEIVRKDDKPHDANFEKMLFSVIEEAFKTRRKMLKNTLGSIVPTEVFKSAAIDSSLRAENLTYLDFVRLVELLYSLPENQK